MLLYYFTSPFGEVKLVKLSGSCPFTVIVNGREVARADRQPDAEREYNSRCGAFERVALTLAAEKRVSRFWSEITPVRLASGEIVYA